MNYNQYEILDRSSNILSNIEDQLLDHEDITKSQNKKVSKAMRLLGKVYQEAGLLALSEKTNE